MRAALMPENGALTLARANGSGRRAREATSTRPTVLKARKRSTANFRQKVAEDFLEVRASSSTRKR